MRSSEERKSDCRGKRGVPSRSHSQNNRLRLNAAPRSTGKVHCAESTPDHAKIRRGTYRIPYRKHVESLLSKDLLQSLKQNALIYIVYWFFFSPRYENRHEFIKCSNKIIHRMAAHNMHWCTCGSYNMFLETPFYLNTVVVLWCFLFSEDLDLGNLFIYLYIYFFTILGMSTKLHTSHFLQYILSLHTLIDNMRGFQECMRLDSAHLFAYLYLTIHQHVRKNSCDGRKYIVSAMKCGRGSSILG